jgi:dTDP-4-dehydrorhamnose reductase
MKKIYMAGSGGMLGDAFYQQFKDRYVVKCSDIDVNDSWLSFLDFRDYDKYREDVISFKADWIFHLGAFTDLEYCENHPEETYETNTKSVQHAVSIANELDIPLLYISTAGIFDGLKEVYDESDQPIPLGHYGNSKYLGEKFVQENAKSYIICRAGWMMGGGEKKDKKFIQKLMRQIVSGKKSLQIVNDKLGTPTYTHDFAANTSLLIDKGERGLFNMVCQGMTGRVEVAHELLRLLNMDKEIRIEEVSTEYFSKEYFAERPACERLVNKKLNDSGLNIMRDWKTALADYINAYYSNLIK